MDTPLKQKLDEFGSQLANVRGARVARGRAGARAAATARGGANPGVRGVARAPR
jgi:hypothetical protein